MTWRDVLDKKALWSFEQANCRRWLAGLPDDCVQCCVTSPPYWGLRDYGTGKWEGGDPSCSHEQEPPSANGECQGTVSVSGHAAQGERNARGECHRCGARRIDDQIGLEASIERYVEVIVGVFQEVKRVLRDDGTLWLNLGDSYCTKPIGSGSTHDPKYRDGRNRSEGFRCGRTNRPGELGLKHKDLCGIPWRVAFALQADGWYLRSDIIWEKPNAMPESVTDRPTKSHEYLFLLSKSARYYYDNGAIEEPMTAPEASTPEDVSRVHNRRRATCVDPRQDKIKVPAGWDTKPGAHGTIHREGRASDPVYVKAPRDPGPREPRPGIDTRGGNQGNGQIPNNSPTRNRRTVWSIATQPFPGAHFATFPTELVAPCILAGSRADDVVLDPFGGAGTTVMVAVGLGRRGISCDLNRTYAEMARRRIRDDRPLFNGTGGA